MFENPIPLHGLDGNEFDAVAVLHHLHRHAGCRLKSFTDVLGDDHLELGRENKRSHGIYLNIVVRMLYR